MLVQIEDSLGQYKAESCMSLLELYISTRRNLISGHSGAYYYL